MTPRLPRITADEIIRILLKKGFYLDRQHGSHKIYINNKGVRVTVPYHKGKTLNLKIVQKIFKDADIEPEDFH